ncbi:response regulator transcription factor [uncultured Paludibaculum sp.]|uniref:response regulator transcription factor n=1 Tax=uncultured Paludibaculum sp. TaxID=1765020 RepID=UPI002AAB8171|nr:response regulator transcription factor [uncultured Paludibaculum sp.]
MYTLLLVDDHKIMRDGLRAILKNSGEFEVVAEAETGLEAIAQAVRLRPNLILMDINLPGISGIEATVEIMRNAPDAKIVILSMHDDESSVIRSIRNGARAFVLKKASDRDLLDALRTVARGGSYLSPQVSDTFLSRVQRGNLNDTQARTSVQTLTPREQQVMRMVAEGQTSKEIAVVLNLSLQTVRGYRKTLMKKLGVSNVAGLTQVALANGLANSHGRSGRGAVAG